MIEGNLLIRASAGTGKTFSLATRFIRLMMFDSVEPERIVALTFSRAAAQEIYAMLLKRLWKAAESEKGACAERDHLLAGLSVEARRQVDALGIEWSRKSFADVLRRVVESQHFGAIATLDSFILRLVRNFPLEFGFQNAVEVLDPVGEKEAVSTAAKAILDSASDSGDFMQAFRNAKRGCFSRLCARTLEEMMEREGWRAFMLEHPECVSWSVESMSEALGVEDFAGFMDSSKTRSYGTLGLVSDRKALSWLSKFIEHIVKTAPGDSPIPSKSSIAIEFAKAVACHPGEPYVEHSVKRSDGSSEMERRDYPQAVFDAAHADLVRLAGAFFVRQLRVVEAKLKLLSIIEREYDAATRRMGRLTFQDFTNAAKDDGAGLELDNLRFRFDTRLDHWALDEFQDTSEVQWACLRPLVESAASGGGGRSVSVVGDLKQSIYTWRGGDDKPFEEMMGWPWFSTDDDGTVHGSIVDSKISHRYGKRIADFINAVFGKSGVGDCPMIPRERSSACERWLRDDCWLEHIPEFGPDGKPVVSDYVKVVGSRPDGASTATDLLLRTLYDEIAPVWAAHNAAGSGETVGVLVRRNEDGAKVAEYLRGRGLPVVWEGLDAVCDMPVVQAVMEMLRLSEHPEDTFAWTVVDRLFPLREKLMPGLDSAAAVSAKVAELVSHKGLSRTLSDFCGVLCADGAGLDGLSCQRLRALVRLGVLYERRRSQEGIEGFVKFVASAGKRESAASANVIRILSIHRSKGLTLDRVFVPLFETESVSMVEPSRYAALYWKGCDWVLPHVSSAVAMLNERTAKALALQRDARLLEQLRLHYVALTRSRKALYVLFPTEDHDGLLFRDLLSCALKSGAPRSYGATTVLFEDGEPPPFAPAEESGAACGRDGWPLVRAEPRIERVSPSRFVHAVQAAGRRTRSDSLFESGYGAAARRGIEAHASYQAIEWADEETLAKLPPAFREAFAKPCEDASVWRERSYELFDGRRWETGQFDRVVFAGSGESRSAAIYDFKTNAIGEGEDDSAFTDRMRRQYASQMESYAKALSALTGIRPQMVSAKLLLLSTGQVVPCAQDLV